MRKRPGFVRLTASVAAAALLWDVVAPRLAIAQLGPPPLPRPYQAGPRQAPPDLSQGDPPARVGRIARIAGTVSFRNEGDTQWSPASVNYPVSTGNAFWAEPSATAELEVSDSRIALAGTTEFDVSALDASGLQAVAAQGEAYLNLRNLASNEAWSIQTPRGLVRLSAAGRYDIVVGTTEQPTLVTVVDGAAEVEGPNLSLHVGSGQTATIDGTDSFQGNVGPAQRTAFLTAKLDAERPPPMPLTSVPAQVSAMPGGSDLTNYGNWSDAPEYGHVWYPPVPAGWVPYREGRWAYVAPWGWTWIDDAPWGFAPFHYGRWIELGGRWAWTPGGYAVAGPPVYAPALVAFIGIGAGVAIGAAFASGSIGWVPLGPHERFRPWYRASDRYAREVNVSHVTNINNSVTINNTTTNIFINRRAATAIPGTAMAASRPVQSVAQPITAQQFAAARPIVGQQPMRPIAATAGMTPVVAQRLNLGPTTSLRTSPGPAVLPHAHGPPGGGIVRPAGMAPGRVDPGIPAFRPGGGNPFAAPGPSIQAPATATGGPAGVPTPQVTRSALLPPVTGAPAPPNILRPTGASPAASLLRSNGAILSPAPSSPAQAPHAGPQQAPQPIAPVRPQLPRVIPPTAPAQPFAQPAAVAHTVPLAAMPKAQPQHFMPPPAPREQQQHFTPPASRPEPARQAAQPQPPPRQKRPGER